MGSVARFVGSCYCESVSVGAGTSAHLVGSALLACTLGPAAAVITMTAILAVQALVFQDGGLLALGANVMNMAAAGVFAGYLPYRIWGVGRWRKAAVFTGGVLSVLVAAALTLTELRISGVPLPATLAGLSMGLFLIGALAEGAITMAVFSALERMNPGWIRSPEGAAGQGRRVLAAAAILLGTVGAVLASGLPDGLESLAEKTGIAERARNLFETPLLDYELRGISSGWAGKAAAGLLGLVVTYAVCVALTRLLARRRSA
jgi:cobalt/nickel transport system permease protein